MLERKGEKLEKNTTYVMSYELGISPMMSADGITRTNKSNHMMRRELFYLSKAVTLNLMLIGVTKTKIANTKMGKLSIA